MPDVVVRKCPNCGGVLPAVGLATKVRCEFCGHELDVKHTVAQPRVQAHAPPTAPWPVAPSRRASTWIAFVPVVATVGIALAVNLSRSAVVGSAAQPPEGVAGVLWMKTVGLVAANSDAVEDVVMLVREQTAEGSDQIRLGVWDGASMRPLWRSASFGGYGQAYQYTHAAVMDRRVLVTDFRSQAHLFDLASGAALSRTPLPDRAKSLCAGPGPTQVRLAPQSGPGLLFDTATGAVVVEGSADWGAFAAATDLGAPDCRAPSDLSQPGAEELPFDPPPPGLQEVHRLVAGDVRLATGRRASGVRVPMVLGLGPDGVTPTWSLIVPTVEETQVTESGSDTLLFHLAGDRLHVGYKLTDGSGRLAAIDARTGARLWETPFTTWASGVSVEALRVGPRRIVLEQWLEADVFDTATGALLIRMATR